VSEVHLTLPPDLFEAIAARAAELVQPADRGGYVTAKTAAAMLDCDTRRIYKLTRSGRLPAYREGGRVLLRRSDVEALVEPQEGS
jgi:excisionase family DNA binding protein